MPDVSLAEFLAQIGANVRRLRGERMTQQSLAELLQMSVQYVSLIERGRVNMEMETFVRIANALEARPAELIQSRTRIRPAKPGRPRKRRPRRGT